ncbi:MAG: linearmycin/streptolysin transport system ATP-binding protein [Candidatus Binataceae bacterium]|jgi:ABC-2 type transport system ATP-binding protein|nr:linearmycin/streptolysin transport system ATP-binding protein [Candidatus Binataceae bacterium]MEA2679988.1 linearmycin/streptolysin transport system ATP-binding protein [Candidatus Binataceae bacterium]HWN58873.1 ABC transporter ATP-binding protein [Methylomirabilota bacterium]
MTNSGPVIEAQDLRKRYGDRVAVDGVSVTVHEGEIVGLLGPNGAGKTTTLSMLSGVIAPDTGRVSIAGYDLASSPRKARERLGLVPQSLALYPTLTALENLMFFGRMEGLSSRDALNRATGLLEEVGLSDRSEDMVGEFSGGMKRRLNIACGMLHYPAAVMLDEPTAGVDPQSRGRIFAVVESAARSGGAILYSTHYMEEAERLCNRIVLIDHGRIVAQGTGTELIALAGTEPRLEIVTKKALPKGWSNGIAGVIELPWEVLDEFAAALTLATIDQVPDVIKRAGEIGEVVVEFHVHRPNLQDAFLKLTGHALRDAR